MALIRLAALACVTFLVFPFETNLRASALYLANGASVQVLDPALHVQSAFDLPAGAGDILGITAGTAGELYVATAQSLFHFADDGTLLHAVDNAGGGDLAYRDGVLYLAGGKVVSEWDSTLGLLGFFTLADPINGIAAGPADDFFVATPDAVLHVSHGGTVLHSAQLSGGTDVTFGDGNVHVAGGNTIFSLNGALGLLGFSLLPPSLGSITGIAAGAFGETYVSTAQSLLRLSGSTVLGSIAVTNGADVSFTSASVPVSVPEPSTMLLLSLGLVLLAVPSARARRATLSIMFRKPAGAAPRGGRASD